MNCPINEQTADGAVVGRCWFYLPDGKTCKRHGDVSDAVERYMLQTKLTLESNHNPKLKLAIERNRQRKATTK